MDRDAFDKTIESGLVTFYSRSRRRLWTKGETSGNHLKLSDIHIDCDRDTLLIKATPSGPVCHTGSATCFEGDTAPSNAAVLYDLERVIAQRRSGSDGTSYTSSLFANGINRIAQKVGEEAVEVVIEAMSDDADKFKGEAADLLFHLLVLLRAKDMNLDEIFDILQSRRR
jgi:phosphoribosyl-ATP pyrophosphohydrolase/phosphoribosyl-AMP cyclohydrolase